LQVDFVELISMTDIYAMLVGILLQVTGAPAEVEEGK
jgi:hypothetical protein